MTYLHTAIRKGNLKLVKELASGQKTHFRQPIHYLFGICNIINTKNFHGDTPLLLALKLYSQNPNSYQQILYILLKAKANTEIADQNGNTPLNITATNGLLKAAQLLIDFMAMPHPKGKSISPLSNAALVGNMNMIQLLLDNDAKINGTDEFMTPLQAAVISKDIKIIEFLLQKGANINQVTSWQHDDYRTALWYAVDYALKSNSHDNRIIKLLLLNGADPNICYTQFPIVKVLVLHEDMRAYVDNLIETFTDEEKAKLKLSNANLSFITNSSSEVIRYSPKHKSSLKIVNL